MQQIAFIGLGHMGHPMVLNLLQRGYPVTVYDKVPAAIASLAKQGATPANSLSTAVHDADVVISMLQTGEQVSSVCLGEQGIFAKLKAGTLYIDSSSIDVATTRHLHEAAQAADLVMVDAPVSGGVAGAQAASLTIMVGGQANAFAKAKPILETVGKTIVHAGQAGNGQVAKICNNMLLGIAMIGVAEAFTLADKLGLDAKTFQAISTHASGQCWAMSNYNPVPGVLDNVPASHHYQPGFSARMMQKDLHLSQQAASKADMSTPLGAHATQLYDDFVEQDQGELDFSAIIKML